MVVVGEDGSAAPHQAVEPLRDADGEALHAARERVPVVRLDEQMQMVALDGVVDDAHSEADFRRAEGFLERGEDTLPAEPRNRADGAQGHVNGVMAGQLLTRQVRDARALLRRAATPRVESPEGFW